MARDGRGLYCTALRRGEEQQVNLRCLRPQHYLHSSHWLEAESLSQSSGLRSAQGVLFSFLKSRVTILTANFLFCARLPGMLIHSSYINYDCKIIFLSLMQRVHIARCIYNCFPQLYGLKEPISFWELNDL